MSETRLNISATPVTLQMTVLPPQVENLQSPDINLMSSDGKYMMKLPRSDFPNINPATGEPLVVSLTLFRAVVEPVPEKLVDLTPKILRPN